VDASVIEANASRYHGKAPDELDWTGKQRQKRAVAEYLAALEAEAAAEEDAPDDGAGGGPASKRRAGMSQRKLAAREKARPSGRADHRRVSSLWVSRRMGPTGRGLARNC